MMWANFGVIYGDGKVATVGKKIGGKVGANIELGEKDPNLVLRMPARSE